MTSPSSRRITSAWALLVLLTLVSMAAGHAGPTPLVANGVVLTAAVFKGRWMIMDFMKLRTVPSGWRTLFLSWLMLVAVAAWTTAALPLLRG